MLSIETCIWFWFQFEIQLIQDYFPPALELNKLKTLVECLEGKQGVKSPPPLLSELPDTQKSVRGAGNTTWSGSLLLCEH